MNLEQLIDYLKESEFAECITSWTEIPERDAIYCEFNSVIDHRLIEVLKKNGIQKLYSHQAKAIDKVRKGNDVVIVTPTSSGKTMCYNIPVLNTILEDFEARALFLFPTKALAQDQANELYQIVKDIGVDIKSFTYDGDTPQSARKAIRQAGHIVVTNPDMLHGGILPHHTKWTKLFENLKYVVIDEIHHYRGVFGSHLANVVRRLKRICQFYGSDPQFICCSATISNPDELTERIIEKEVVLINENGAPTGKKHIIFYNPPYINKQLGIRRSSLIESKRITELLLKNDVQTILFTRSRLNVEVLVTYLKGLYSNNILKDKTIRGYRGGYLPKQRREIERGLRNGEIKCVVSTNALELGVDIGSLQACVICGYPGTIASTWQQAGRAGRRNDIAVVIVVASSSPIDQYITNNPEYFLKGNPENGLVNPNNLNILYNHMKCAAFELPFESGEQFGIDQTEGILSYMEEAKIVRRVGNRWHWMNDIYPSAEISLRSAANENFIIIDITDARHKVIGEVDRFSAPMLIHEEAIYIHEGQQYQVEKLDFDYKKAFVRMVDVDYYTDANLSVDLKVLDVFKSEKLEACTRYTGEVMVSCIVTKFKKVKLYTHENIGAGPVELPELDMHTTAYWISFADSIERYMPKAKLKNALIGFTNIISNVVPIYLMCDIKDINVIFQVKSPFTSKATVYVYETAPGGVGFSDKLYNLHNDILNAAKKLLKKCPCQSGCPSCVGTLHEFSDEGDAKALTLELIDLIGV